MILDNQDQYTQLLDRLQDNDVILIPVWSDVNYHIVNNTLTALYIYLVQDETDYMMLYRHDERLFSNTEIVEKLREHPKNVYVTDKKALMHKFDFSNSLDMNLLNYLLTTDTLLLHEAATRAHTYFYSKDSDVVHVNSYIPAIKHLEMCRNQKDMILEVVNKHGKSLNDPTFKIYNSNVVHNYNYIERSGLAIDKEKFNEFYPDKSYCHLPEKGLIYSEYNLFTSTGRPSNAYQSVNFAALNKENGERGVFKSRFDKGALLEMDFDAYHLRLIADMIGYKFPDNCNVHEYLGKQYFGKEQLTEEEYKQSKGVSFQLIYGGIYEEFEQIEYFKLLKDYIYKIWEGYKKNGYIESKFFKRKIRKGTIDKINRYKLWNYLIQLHETENNNVILYKLLKVLENYQSKLILYTYDSFLFDMVVEDGKQFIGDVKQVLECGGRFPIKIKYGKNYHDMISGVYNE